MVVNLVIVATLFSPLSTLQFLLFQRKLGNNGGNSVIDNFVFCVHHPSPWVKEISENSSSGYTNVLAARSGHFYFSTSATLACSIPEVITKIAIFLLECLLCCEVYVGICLEHLELLLHSLFTLIMSSLPSVLMKF